MSSGEPVVSSRREQVATFVAAMLLVAQQVASKATRDALFLVSFDPRRLPVVMGTAAMLSLAIVLLTGRALTRFGPRRVVVAGLGLNAALFATEWLAAARSPAAVAVAVYLHVATVGAVLISGFWLLVSERFDPHRTRKVVARVAGAAALGGVLGGVGEHFLAGATDARATLLGLAAVSTCAAVAVGFVPSRAAARDPSPTTHRSAWHAMRGSSYLRALAALSVLAAAWEALLDFALKSGAAHALHGGAALISFFALFYTTISVATFLVQVLLGPLVLERGGVGTSLATLPAVVVLGIGALFGAPFALVIALRGGETVFANSFFRSAYEVLFAPLPPETKRPTKTIVDVAATRIGDGLGALLVLGLLLVWPHPSAAVPIVAAVVLAGLGLIVVRRVSRGYVDTLKTALQVGTDASPDTRGRPSVIGETTTTGGRDLLQGAVVAIDSVVTTARLGARVDALLSSDTERIRAALVEPLVREVVPVAVPLIVHPELGREAAQALRLVAASNLGVLTDMLGDAAVPLEVRVRIPRLMHTAPGERAVGSLLFGLRDVELDVRYYCARCLAHIVAKDAKLAPATEIVLGFVQRELDHCVLEWTATARAGVATSDDDEPHELDELLRLRANRGLEHVFTLLAIVVEAEPLRLALRGLSSSDDDVRGTALELLENILPDSVRRPVIAALSSQYYDLPRASRARDHLVAELQGLRLGRAGAADPTHGSGSPPVAGLSGTTSQGSGSRSAA